MKKSIRMRTFWHVSLEEKGNPGRAAENGEALLAARSMCLMEIAAQMCKVWRPTLGVSWQGHGLLGLEASRTLPWADDSARRDPRLVARRRLAQA